MDKEQILASGLIEQYVMGLTSPEESIMVEECVQKYPELGKKIDCMKRGMHSYCSKRLKPKRQSGAVIVMHKLRVAKTLAGMMSLLVLGLSFLVYKLYQEAQAAEKKLALLTAKFDESQTKQQVLHEQFKMVCDTGTRKVQLKHLHASSPSAIVYFNPIMKNICLDILHLDSPPDGHQYHLWSKADGVDYNLGIIDCHQKKNLLHKLQYVDNPDHFTLTLEASEKVKSPSLEHLQAQGEINL